MLNFMRPTREKSYLRGSKNMPWNKLRGGIDGRRIARPQLAVDFEQRVVLLLDAVLRERHRNDVAHVVELGEEESKVGMFGFDQLATIVGVSS